MYSISIRILILTWAIDQCIGQSENMCKKPGVEFKLPVYIDKTGKEHCFFYPPSSDAKALYNEKPWTAIRKLVELCNLFSDSRLPHILDGEMWKYFRGKLGDIHNHGKPFVETLGRSMKDKSHFYIPLGVAYYSFNEDKSTVSITWDDGTVVTGATNDIYNTIDTTARFYDWAPDGPVYLSMDYASFDTYYGNKPGDNWDYFFLCHQGARKPGDAPKASTANPDAGTNNPTGGVPTTSKRSKTTSKRSTTLTITKQEIKGDIPAGAPGTLSISKNAILIIPLALIMKRT